MKIVLFLSIIVAVQSIEVDRLDVAIGMSLSPEVALSTRKSFGIKNLYEEFGQAAQIGDFIQKLLKIDNNIKMHNFYDCDSENAKKAAPIVIPILEGLSKMPIIKHIIGESFIHNISKLIKECADKPNDIRSTGETQNITPTINVDESSSDEIESSNDNTSIENFNKLRDRRLRQDLDKIIILQKALSSKKAEDANKPSMDGLLRTLLEIGKHLYSDSLNNPNHIDPDEQGVSTVKIQKSTFSSSSSGEEITEAPRKKYEIVKTNINLRGLDSSDKDTMQQTTKVDERASESREDDAIVVNNNIEIDVRMEQ